MAAVNLPASTYAPAIVTEQDADTYLALVKSVDKRVVSDEMGVYYHELKNGDEIYAVNLMNGEKAALKSLLTSTVGLMEPVYSHTADTSIRVDWDETARRRDYLANEAGLKLLPLSATKAYHAQIEAFASASAGKYRTTSVNAVTAIANAATMTSDAYSGNMALYNPDYYKSVVAPIASGAAYLVGGAGATSYYGQQLSASMGGIPPREKSAIPYKLVRTTMGASGTIAFIPFDYFKVLNKGGYGSHSGCHYTSVSELKQLIRLNAEMTDVPYLSAITSVVKNNERSEISNARSAYLQELREIPRKRRESEKACLVGLRALDVSGIIESRRLR
jgi:hypothetical protein